MIKNLLTGDFYVGSSVRLKERFKSHLLPNNAEKNTVVPNQVKKEKTRMY